jgi:hypothetical protein
VEVLQAHGEFAAAVVPVALSYSQGGGEKRDPGCQQKGGQG